MSITMTLKARYELTEKARTELALAGTPTARYQAVEIEVDAEEAIARGLAYVGDDGSISQKTGGGTFYGGPIGEAWVLEHGTEGSTGMWKSDHVLMVDEAAARYEAAWKETSEAKAKKQREEDEKQAAENARVARGIELLRKTPAGEWAIYTGWGSDRSVRAVGVNPGPDYIGVDKGQLPADLLEAAQAEESRRVAAREKKAADEKATVLAERDAWIAAHGSDRLKKGAAAGMLERMGGVYRSERIAVDLGPEWKCCDAVSEDEENERRNPSEAELDALLESRKRWPDEALEVQLKSVRRGANDEDPEPGNWRAAMMMRLPWERDTWAVRFLDENRTR